MFINSSFCGRVVVRQRRHVEAWDMYIMIQSNHHSSIQKQTKGDQLLLTTHVSILTETTLILQNLHCRTGIFLIIYKVTIIVPYRDRPKVRSIL